MPGKSLVIEAVAVRGGRQRAVGRRGATGVRTARARRWRRSRSNKSTRKARFAMLSIYERDDLRPGDAIDGPAVIRETNATTVIEPGLAGDAHAARPPRA